MCDTTEHFILLVICVVDNSCWKLHLDLFDVIPGLVGFLQLHVEANCQGTKTCRNMYFPAGRLFYRSCQNLTQVPMDIPPDAVKVVLFCNSFTSVPAGVFSYLVQCTCLELYENQIYLVDKQAFKGMTSLLELYLYRNRIPAIGPGTFGDLKFLEILYLWGNTLSSIESGIFSQVHKLKTLLLNKNQISHIEDGAFDYLFSLEILDLAKNRLTTLSPDLLTNLPRTPLQLGLGAFKIPHNARNLWNCLSLCWLKHEEQQGTIRWYVSPQTQRQCSPVCAAGGEWDLLQCPEPGEFSSSCPGHSSQEVKSKQQRHKK